jgi:hypothetical protein
MRSLLETTSEVAAERLHLRYVTACGPSKPQGPGVRVLLAKVWSSKPPETTVKMYIRGLQEYNEVKDIGQQLIGLIAENRGVPIRTLYENGEYGVSIPP